MPDPIVSVDTPRGAVTIASRPGPDRRARRRLEAHRAFVAGHWAELAAAAYAGYRRHGAGAVVLWRADGPRRRLPGSAPHPFEPERLWYATQIHTLPGTTAADFDGWEARQLEAYDPDAEGLVVFVEGGGVRGYRVSGPPAPPQALAEARAGEN